MNMENPVLTAHGLVKRYGSTNALDGLDLELPQGQIIGLLGPNGSGKTTFMKLAAGSSVPRPPGADRCRHSPYQ